MKLCKQMRATAADAAGWLASQTKKKEEGSKTSFCVIQKVCMEYRECKKKKMEEE